MPLPPHGKACCHRCGAILYRDLTRSLDGQLAAVATALVVFLVAHSFPLLTLDLGGVRTTTTLLGGITRMMNEYRPLVAGLVFFTTLMFPLVELTTQLYLLIALRMGQCPRGLRWLLRGLQMFRPWTMIEVLMVGILVSMAKLDNVAEVEPGVALWAFCILTVLLTWVTAMPLHAFWEAAEVCWHEYGRPTRKLETAPPTHGHLTSAGAGLVACQYCGLLCRWLPHKAGTGFACPRCGGALHQRKLQSLALTWAYLAAAAILYIPANILPVMRTTTLLSTQDDTILSGVVYLWNTGSPLLAVIVFIASIVVPILKMASLALLAFMAQQGIPWQLWQRGRLFRIVELTGRWSMLDVYVVTLMGALVHTRSAVTIVAGSGATAFGVVVVLTMLASQSFDPRLTWDTSKNKEKYDRAPRAA